MVGRRFITGGIAVESVRVRPDTELTNHDHECVHICSVIDGSFDELTGHGRHRCIRGSSRISPAGDRHDIRFGGEGARCVVLFVDDETARGLRTWRERVFFESEGVIGAATRLWTLLQPAGSSDVFLIENVMWELISQIGRSRERPRSRPVPPWLRRIYDRLSSCPDAIPAIDALARAEGVSREHLARAFRSHFRASPADFLRRVRLQRACRRLIESDQPIATIAAECGFADQSHLTRVCQVELHVTPGALRRRGSRNITSVQEFPIVTRAR